MNMSEIIDSDDMVMVSKKTIDEMQGKITSYRAQAAEYMVTISNLRSELSDATEDKERLGRVIDKWLDE
jgi:hypothetical protein